MPRAPLLRLPYTDPLPAPRILPASAATTSGAIAALVDFLSPSLPRHTPASTPSSKLNHDARTRAGSTLLLTGAGISVASGLADYRGTNGTYTLNKTYRPIYFSEFCASHETRKRYWARSFIGWTNLERARPNRTHEACADLGRLGVVERVITQSMSIAIFCKANHVNTNQTSIPFIPPHIPICRRQSSTATCAAWSV